MAGRRSSFGSRQSLPLQPDKLSELHPSDSIFMSQQESPMRPPPASAPHASGSGRFRPTTPVEEYVSKYMVVKHSWRGKYERIFAVGPTRFSTIDPKDFEVTNTWALTALSNVQVDPESDDFFILSIKGPKKEEQLRLRCSYRAQLLSDLYNQQNTFARASTGFTSTHRSRYDVRKWSHRPEAASQDEAEHDSDRNEVRSPFIMEIASDALLLLTPEGVQRSRFPYISMDHLSAANDDDDAFILGLQGRDRVFFCHQRSQLLTKAQQAAKQLDLTLSSKRPTSLTQTMIQRKEYGKDVGSALCQFTVQKKAPSKQKEPLDRVLSIHEKYFVEHDMEDNVVSCLSYADIHVITFYPNRSEKFGIEFAGGRRKVYMSSKRDDILADLYDRCITGKENSDILIMPFTNVRGLRLLPFDAQEDTNASHEFFDDQSMSSFFLQRLHSIHRPGSGRNAEDKGFIDIAEEFNANVSPSGIPYNSSQSVVQDALRAIGPQLYYVSKTQPVSTRSACALLQTLYRIAPSFYGFQQIAQVAHMGDSISKLLVSKDPFVIFWTTLLLQRLFSHAPFASHKLDGHMQKQCLDAERRNKAALLGNTVLLEALVSNLKHIESKSMHSLIVMGVIMVLETTVGSSRDTTRATEAKSVVSSVVRCYKSLLTVLLESHCSTTVEACVLLLKATLEECDLDVANRMRDTVLDEGIALTYLYEAITHPSFDQRRVSRHLTALWMSHHDPSKQLLSRILPKAFLSFLDEPLLSTEEQEQMDEMEQRQVFSTNSSVQESRQASSLSSSVTSAQVNDVTGEHSAGPSSFDSSERVQSMTSSDHMRLQENKSFAGESISSSSRKLQKSVSALPPATSPPSLMPRASSAGAARRGVLSKESSARLVQRLQSSDRSIDATPAPASTHAMDSGRVKSRTSLDQSPRKRMNVSKIVQDAVDKMLPEKHSHSVTSIDKEMEKSTLERREAENFNLLFYMLSQDHYQVELIWNESCREELKKALATQVESIGRLQEKQGTNRIRWNHEDFRIDYDSLHDEVVVDGCYLDVLCALPNEHFEDVQEDKFIALSPDDVRMKFPEGVIRSLYQRLLRESIRAEYFNDIQLSHKCVRGMMIVAAAYAKDNGVSSMQFNDLDYLLQMITETKHNDLVASLTHLLRALCMSDINARNVLVHKKNVDIILQLLRMVHASSNVDVDGDDQGERVWIVTKADGESELMNVGEVKQLCASAWDVAAVPVQKAEVKCCEPCTDEWKVSECLQLRWQIMTQGTLDMTQVSHDAASLLLDVAHSTVRNTEMSPYPAPVALEALWSKARELVSLLAEHRTPELRHKVLKLLEFMYSSRWDFSLRDENADACISRKAMYKNGLFYLLFVGEEIDAETTAALLKATHLGQDGKEEDSALTAILPDAMISHLTTSSAETFAATFGGSVETPHVVWNQDMRRHVRDSCLAHMQDYMSCLTQDTTSHWQFVPMAPVRYPELDDDIWCNGVYLQQFCLSLETVIEDPIIFMHALTDLWEKETTRAPCPYDDLDIAADILDVSPRTASSSNDDNAAVVRDGFKRMARQVLLNHADELEYRIRMKELYAAYDRMTCPRPTLLSAGHDPTNLRLILQALVIMCKRYGTDLKSYVFPSYAALLSLLLTHCSAEGSPTVETTEQQRADISEHAAELLYLTCSVNQDNEQLLLEFPDVRSLEKVLNYCVDALVDGDGTSMHEHVSLHLLPTITGLLALQEGRKWAAQSPTLIVDMMRILWLWNHTSKQSLFLSKITQQVLEAMAYLSLSRVNQNVMCAKGAVWQLLLLFSEYNVEMDPRATEERVQEVNIPSEDFDEMRPEIQNYLAILAVKALCRITGVAEKSEVQPPRNLALKAALDALLTPNLANLLTVSDYHEYLKLYHGDCESYTLYWNASMREELLAYVRPRGDEQPSAEMEESLQDIVDFRFEYLGNVVTIGGLYLETLISSFEVIRDTREWVPPEELGIPNSFFTQLFACIDAGALKQDKLKETKSASTFGSYLAMNSTIVSEASTQYSRVQEIDVDDIPTDIDSIGFPDTVSAVEEEEVGLDLPDKPHAGWQVPEEDMRTVHRVTCLHALEVMVDVAPILVEEAVAKDKSALKMLFRVLFPPGHEVHKSDETEDGLALPEDLYEDGRLHCLHAIEGLSVFGRFAQEACTIGVCDILIELTHLCREVGVEALGIIRNLCESNARQRAVEDIMHSGCYIEFLAMLILVGEYITEKELEIATSMRLPAAQVLSAMCKFESETHLEARRTLCRFFPVAMVYQLTTYPDSFVEFYSTDHKNPELVWDEEFRIYLRESIGHCLAMYYSSPSMADSSAGDPMLSAVSTFQVDYTPLYPYPMAGDVYLLLFLDDPTYRLRDPHFFATCLWEEFDFLFRELSHLLSTLQKGPDIVSKEAADRDIELLDLVTSCLVVVLQVYPNLLDRMADLNAASQCVQMLQDTFRAPGRDPCLVSAMRVLRILSLSKPCVSTMQKDFPTLITCVQTLVSPARGGPLHFEAAYSLGVLRRVVKNATNHGERDPNAGIVAQASQKELFQFLLHILESNAALGAVREPTVVRAIAIDILLTLERDTNQGAMAHQILKKNKPWRKQFRQESIRDAIGRSAEDPFLCAKYPRMDAVIREHLRRNPPNMPPSPPTNLRATSTLDERLTMMQKFRKAVAMTKDTENGESTSGQTAHPVRTRGYDDRV